jgi:histone H1/5
MNVKEEDVRSTVMLATLKPKPSVAWLPMQLPQQRDDADDTEKTSAIKTPARKTPPEESTTLAEESASSTHIPYMLLVMEALNDMKDRTGSSQIAIRKYILANHPEVPASQLDQSLLHTLNTGIAQTRIIKVRSLFRLAPYYQFGKKKEKAAENKMPPNESMTPKQNIPYIQLVEEAIDGMRDRAGSSHFAIGKYIIANRPELSPDKVKKRLSLTLRKGVAQKRIIKVKGSYKIHPCLLLEQKKKDAKIKKPVKKAPEKKNPTKKQLAAIRENEREEAKEKKEQDRIRKRKLAAVREKELQDAKELEHQNSIRKRKLAAILEKERQEAKEKEGQERTRKRELDAKVKEDQERNRKRNRPVSVEADAPLSSSTGTATTTVSHSLAIPTATKRSRVSKNENVYCRTAGKQYFKQKAVTNPSSLCSSSAETSTTGTDPEERDGASTTPNTSRRPNPPTVFSTLSILEDGIGINEQHVGNALVRLSRIKDILVIKGDEISVPPTLSLPEQLAKLAALLGTSE